jgi:cytoskeletal protein RodZ
MLICEQLKEKREAVFLSREELAMKVNLEVSVIYKLETCVFDSMLYFWKVRQLKNYCLLINIEIDEFIRELNDFAYLWDGSEQGWVIVSMRNGTRYQIFNLTTRDAFLVENDIVLSAIIEKMKLNGCEVISSEDLVGRLNNG